MKNTKLFLSILASTTLISFAHADDCAPIRLDAPGGSMEHVAVRNQRSIGSCYAHASAQMYDAWRFAHEEQKKDTDYYEDFSSGFEIGQRAKINNNREIEGNAVLSEESRDQLLDKDINGGGVEDLLPVLLKEGTCSQKELNGLFRKDVRTKLDLDVDSYASMVMYKFTHYRSEFYSERKKIYAKYAPQAEKVSTHTANDNIRVSTTEQAYLRSKVREIEIDMLRERILAKGRADVEKYNLYVLSNPDLDINYSLLEANSNTVRMFEVLSIMDCADSRRLKTKSRFEVQTHKSYDDGRNLFRYRTHPARYLPEVTRETLSDEFSKGLKGAYPIGIGYCSTVLREGRKFKAKKDNDESCGFHASLIIGRRPNPKNPKSCQYLVRNTWGKSCGGYSKDWDCEAEKGSLWIDSDTLGQAIYELQTLRPLSD